MDDGYDSGGYDSGSTDSGSYDSGSTDSGSYDSGSTGAYDAGSYESSSSGSYDAGSYEGSGSEAESYEGGDASLDASSELYEASGEGDSSETELYDGSERDGASDEPDTELYDGGAEGDLEGDAPDTSDASDTPDTELYDDADRGDSEETELYDGPEAGDGPDTELIDDAGRADVTEGDVSESDAPSDDWDDIDFTTTSNTPYEQAVIAEMDESGELDIPEEDPTLDEPEFGTPHLPTEATGTFEGERGNSAFVPSSEEARAAMAEYGQDSVEYVNGEPDFSPFTQHETPYGDMSCEVEIGHMTTDRANPSWEYGDRRPTGTSHDPNYDLGNFAQADNALVDRAIEQNPGLVEGKSPEEVAQLRADMASEIESWRTSNGLTWHETTDGTTMQLVPTSIHDACRHSGGVSTMRTVQAYGDIRRPE